MLLRPHLSKSQSRGGGGIEGYDYFPERLEEAKQQGGADYCSRYYRLLSALPAPSVQLSTR